MVLDEAVNTSGTTQLALHAVRFETHRLISLLLLLPTATAAATMWRFRPLLISTGQSAGPALDAVPSLLGAHARSPCKYGPTIRARLVQQNRFGQRLAQVCAQLSALCEAILNGAAQCGAEGPLGSSHREAQAARFVRRLGPP